MKLIPEALAQTLAPSEQTTPTDAAPAPAPAAPTPPAVPTPPAPTSGQTGTAQPGTPDVPPGATPDPLAQIIPILVIIGIVYIIVLRPRHRKEKEAKEQLKNVRRGDTLVTSSGFIGKVTKAIDDAEVEVEIAPNVRVRMMRTAIAEVRARGEPVKDQAPAKPAKDQTPSKPAKDQSPSPKS